MLWSTRKVKTSAVNSHTFMAWLTECLSFLRSLLPKFTRLVTILFIFVKITTIYDSQCYFLGKKLLGFVGLVSIFGKSCHFIDFSDCRWVRKMTETTNLKMRWILKKFWKRSLEYPLQRSRQRAKSNKKKMERTSNKEKCWRAHPGNPLE